MGAGARSPKENGGQLRTTMEFWLKLKELGRLLQLGAESFSLRFRKRVSLSQDSIQQARDFVRRLFLGCANKLPLIRCDQLCVSLSKSSGVIVKR